MTLFNNILPLFLTKLDKKKSNQLAKSLSSDILEQNWSGLLSARNPICREVFSEFSQKTLSDKDIEAKNQFLDFSYNLAVATNKRINIYLIKNNKKEIPANYYLSGDYYEYRSPKQKVAVELVGGNVFKVWSENPDLSIEVIDWDSIRAKQSSSTATKRQRDTILRERTAIAKYVVPIANVVTKFK
jgi:hypothetical protein